MRSAFYMLLAANLAFMAWAGWIDRPAEARVVESATRLPRLWFAGETPGSEGAVANPTPRRESANRNETSAPPPRTKNQTSSAAGASGSASPSTTRAVDPRSNARVANNTSASNNSGSAGGGNRSLSSTQTSNGSGAGSALGPNGGAASSSAGASNNRAGSAQTRDASPAQLAAALRQASEASGQSFATSVRSASAAARCLTVGPFKDVSRSGRAISLLRERGFSPKQRTENGDSWAGYWVYVGGLKTEAEQAEVVRKLEANGIMDAHSMPDTGEGFQVSVGLFSDRGGANRRSNSVKRLGLNPDIMEKSQAGTLYWVDLNPDGSKQPVPTEGLIALEEAGSRLEMKTCPRGA